MVPIVHFGYCRRFGVADGEREPLAPLGCYIYIYIGLHFMDLSQAEPFDGSAGSSGRFSNVLEASSRILSLKFGHNRPNYR